MEDQTQVNIPLLRKAEWAEVEAALGERGAWYQGDYATQMTNACGTAYCIAGWTLHQAGWSDAEIDKAANNGEAALAALDLLGIPDDIGSGDRSRLFLANNTIADVRRIAETIAGERL